VTVMWPVVKELVALRERLNELFDAALVDNTLGIGEPSSGPFCPAADLYETDEEVVVILEVPGVDASSIDLQLHGDRLRVSGEIGESSESPEGRFIRMEKPCGTFFRDFALPVTRFSDPPRAQLERGILTVRLPKAPGYRRQQVAIAEDEG